MSNFDKYIKILFFYITQQLSKIRYEKKNSRQKTNKKIAPLDTNFALELFDCSVKFELKTLQELTEMVIIVCSDLTRNFNLNDSAVQIILYYLLHPEVISPIFHSFCSHLLFKYFDNISQSPAYLNLPSPELATIIAKLPIEVFYFILFFIYLFLFFIIYRFKILLIISNLFLKLYSKILFNIIILF